MATSKVNLVIGFKLGDEAVLAASLSAWAKHFAKCTVYVVGDKCELPKGVTHIACKTEPGEKGLSKLIVTAAEKLEGETFVYAHNTYPLQKIDLTDIDKPYCEPDGALNTGLPQLYNSKKVLETKISDKDSFEYTYRMLNNKGKTRIPLHDLSDRIRLMVLGLRPDPYRTKHLLKHKKFVVVTKHGQKALENFFS